MKFRSGRIVAPRSTRAIAFANAFDEFNSKLTDFILTVVGFTPMFQKTRLQLLLSFTGVLSVLLSTFAIAVRVIFARSLKQQYIDRLETLARAAALELELEEDGELELDDETLVNANQGIQWFNKEQEFLSEQGDYPLQLPLDLEHPLQTQERPYPAMGFTIPVNDEDTDIFIGYVRVSESTANLDATLRNLDWGLSSGVLVALISSAVGGLWLTRQAMEPIERSFRKLQQFTSDAAHELRSPLMAIQTNAEVALKYPENIRETDAEKFQAIKSASSQLTALTENLLWLARTDRQIFLSRKSVDLQGILKQLIDLYKIQAAAKAIELRSQIDSSLPVMGDEIQLTRMFVNSIDNALRYTLEGGMVEVRGDKTRDRVRVAIQDTGIGIAPEHLASIFDRFWRVEKARSYRAGGFGLGLTLAREIAQNHGGTISVTSELGKGSCFTISLPGTTS